MNEITFVDRVKRYFNYLESEYRFRIILARNSEIRPHTDGIVKYVSENTLVLIDSETGQVTIRLARVKDGERFYLTPIDIYAYLNTNEKEKELLLSTNPKDQSAATALFNEKFLLHQPGWKGGQGAAQDLEKGLENFSKLLKTYDDLCLEGDFSRWPAFYEYKIYHMRADHLRHGRNELRYAEVKDADGKTKLIKESIFKDKLEHVEKLKKEFSK